MQVLLRILSTIGIILLILIGILIALLLLVLFFPFVYKARIVKKEDLTASATVKWLFGLLTVPVEFAEKKLEWDVRIAGFSLKPLLNGDKKKKPKKKKKKAKKQPVIMPGEKADKQVAKDAKAAAKAEIRIRQGKSRESRKIYEEGENEGSFAERLKEKLISLYETAKIAVKVGQAYTAVRKKIFKIVRHVMPKKIRGMLHFGFEDPSATGKTLGMICAVYPVLPAELELVPDFEKAVFECDLLIRGRIFLIYIVVMGLRIYFTKEVRAAIKQVRNR